MGGAETQCLKRLLDEVINLKLQVFAPLNKTSQVSEA